MTKRIVLGICLILLTNISPPWGQSETEKEELSDVLIGEEVSYVEIGGDYLWLATTKGVSRYHFDTKKWDFFTTKDGLISNQVNCIAVEWKEGIFRRSPTGRVWFGTDSGLSVYDVKKNRWQSYTIKDGLIENKIKCISARSDWIWIGTEKGASAYQRKKNRWQSYLTFPGIKSLSVTAIYHDYHYAWIGTNSGLARYNYKYKKWEYFTGGGNFWFSPAGGTRLSSGGSVYKSPIPSDRIYDIEGRGDFVYIGTGGGLVRYNKKIAENIVQEAEAYSQLTSPRRHDASMQARSRSLLGTTNEALRRAADAERNRARRSFVKKRDAVWAGLGWEFFRPSDIVRDKEKSEQISDQILALAVSAGQVWMATNNGLLKFDTEMNNWNWYHKDTGLASNQVSSLAVKGNSVWIGTVHGLSKHGALSGEWKSYKMEKALPSADVLAIGEDVQSVWLATPKAMSQFNPNTERWKTYMSEDGLGGGRVTCVDVVGNYVWVGSDKGISRFDKSNSKWDYFRAAKSGLAADEITSILVDGKYIWVGTKRGLNRYDNTTGEWDVFSTRFGLSNDVITDLAADPKYVWVGTEKGLSRYDKSKGDFDTPGFNTLRYSTQAATQSRDWEIISELSQNTIFSVTEDDGRVCVSTEQGIYLLDGKGKKWRNDMIKSSLTGDVIALDGDKLWIGGWRSLMWYDISSGQTRKFTSEDAQGFSRVRVHDIKPSIRYVWVATDGGIYRYNKADDTWWVYAPSRERGSTDVLVDESIQAIAVGGEFVYFGTPRGISRYDKVTDTWLQFTARDGLINENVSSLLWDGTELWVGTYGGVSKYNLIADRWTNFTRADGLCDNRVTSIVEGEDCLWIGTQKGVSRYDTKTGAWLSFTKDDGLPDNVVWAVVVDGGDVWFGTNRGAARYTPSKNKWKIYTVDDGLLNNIVTSISVGKKYIFLTSPAGVTMYDKEVGSLTPYSQADGLIASEAKSVGSAQKYHWIGTSDGITLYNQITDRSKDFTEAQGLPSNNVQVVAIDGDYIWFGTDAGLARHHWIRGEWTTYSAAPTEIESTASDMVSNNVKSVVSDGNYLWVGTRLGLAKYDKIAHIWRIAHLEFGRWPSRNERLENMEKLVDGAVKAVETALQAVSPVGEQKVYIEYDPKVAGEKAIEALRRMLAMTPPLPGNPTVPSPFIKVDVEFPPNQPVRIISPVLGQLWLGTEAGVIVYDKAREEVREIHPLLPRVRDIKYHQRRVWVLCDDQIAIYNYTQDAPSWILISNAQVLEHTRVQTAPGITERLETASEDLGINDCTALAFLGNLVWLGRENGLKIYETDFRRIKLAVKINIPKYLQHAEITALTSDDRDVWVGTRDGLFQYNSATGNWNTHTVLSGLAGNDISAIACGRKFVWVGTAEEGLSRYDKATKKWDSFNLNDGLADNNIRSITPDGKYVWIGTFSGGVCRFDLTTELWTTYHTGDFMVHESL